MKITKNMNISQIIQKHPETAKILMKHGFHCIGCHVASMETLEQGARAHGMKPAEVDAIVDEMNRLVENE